MLADAGFPNGIDITLTAPPRDPEQLIATAIQQQLQKANIRVNLSIDPSAGVNFTAGKYDAMVNNNVGQADPSFFVNRYFLPNGSNYRLASGAPGDQLT